MTWEALRKPRDRKLLEKDRGAKERERKRKRQSVYVAGKRAVLQVGAIDLEQRLGWLYEGGTRESADTSPGRNLAVATYSIEEDTSAFTGRNPFSLTPRHHQPSPAHLLHT